MDYQTMQNFKQRLLQLRREYKQRVGNIESTLSVAAEDAIGELSTYDQHPADIGDTTFERSKDYALDEDARLKIQAIDDALRRIEQGTYGICDQCGKTIEVERLNAQPYTTKCFACKVDGEERSNLQARPVEEQTLESPYAHTFDDNTYYDREDTWQDMAQHGLSTEIEEVEEEDRGTVQDVEGIVYRKEEGMFFEDKRRMED
ncbi:MAG: TraR/DksA C4-type zinc finger protein [Peptococcaceae bacterium]|nr:TraR/DksA C4-type zinc finger protein [Peptococcaceae bacterium]